MDVGREGGTIELRGIECLSGGGGYGMEMK
jgi:hypothetical protein